MSLCACLSRVVSGSYQRISPQRLQCRIARISSAPRHTLKTKRRGFSRCLHVAQNTALTMRDQYRVTPADASRTTNGCAPACIIFGLLGGVRSIRASMIDDLTTRVCDLVRRGHTIREAAAAVGISPAQAWVRVAALGDTITRRRRRPVSADEREQMIALVDAGLSRAEVGANLNRSKSVIQHHVAGPQQRSGPRRIRSAIRCDQCGVKIIVSPCVRCAAMAATRRTG